MNNFSHSNGVFGQNVTVQDEHALKLANKRKKNRLASQRSRNRIKEFMGYAVEYSKTRKEDAEKLHKININFNRKIKKIREYLLAAGRNDIANDEQLFDIKTNKLAIKRSKTLLKNFTELQFLKLHVGRRAQQDISPLSNDSTSSENPIMLDNSDFFMSFEHNNQNSVNVHYSPAYLNGSKMNASFEKSTQQIRSVSFNSEIAYYQGSSPQSYYPPSITEISEEVEINDNSVESLPFQANLNEYPVVNYIVPKENLQNRYLVQFSRESNFPNQQIQSLPHMYEWNHNQNDKNRLSNGWNGLQFNTNNFCSSWTRNETCNQPANNTQNFYNTCES